MKRDGLEAPEAGEGARAAPVDSATPVDGAAPDRSDPMRACMEAARGGDADAIERIMVHLGPPLLKAARALMGPEHPDVEDLVQEALLAVIDALPSFRAECTLLHFAIRITIRKTTAARRKSQWGLSWLKKFRRGEAPLAAEPDSPCAATIADRRRDLLRTLLQQIPDAQAETLMLRLALGYSVEEIAAITHAPLNTVRSRLRLAKEALRNRIGADPRWAELSGEVS